MLSGIFSFFYANLTLTRIRRMKPLKKTGRFTTGCEKRIAIKLFHWRSESMDPFCWWKKVPKINFLAALLQMSWSLMEKEAFFLCFECKNGRARHWADQHLVLAIRDMTDLIWCARKCREKTRIFLVPWIENRKWPNVVENHDIEPLCRYPMDRARFFPNEIPTVFGSPCSKTAQAHTRTHTRHLLNLMNAIRQAIRSRDCWETATDGD